MESCGTEPAGAYLACCAGMQLRITLVLITVPYAAHGIPPSRACMHIQASPAAAHQFQTRAGADVRAVSLGNAGIAKHHTCFPSRSLGPYPILLGEMLEEAAEVFCCSPYPYCETEVDGNGGSDSFYCCDPTGPGIISPMHILNRRAAGLKIGSPVLDTATQHPQERVREVDASDLLSLVSLTPGKESKKRLKPLAASSASIARLGCYR